MILMNNLVRVSCLGESRYKKNHGNLKIKKKDKNGNVTRKEEIVRREKEKIRMPTILKMGKG